MICSSEGGLMFVRFLVSTAVCAVASYPLAAVAAEPEDQQRSGGEAIIVTATRTPTPITAIPNTVRVIDREGLAQQRSEERRVGKDRVRTVYSGLWTYNLKKKPSN